MPKALFIIADPNSVGLLTKSIFPTIRLLYVKKGIKTETVDLYKSGFDFMSKGNMISNSFIKSYIHSIKTATHIHILTSTALGGFSPAFEGFLDNVIVDQYISKDKDIQKKTFFHVFHINKKKISFFNLVYLRLKLLIIPKAFKNSHIYQYDLNMINNRTKVLQKLRSKILKHI